MELALSIIATIIILTVGYSVFELFKTNTCNNHPKDRKLRIYVVHPYGGSEENKALITEICRVLTFQGYLPISPVHNFSFLDENNPDERELALKLCEELILTADDVWAFGDWIHSEGCIRETIIADKAEIPVRSYSKGAIK